MRAEPRPSIEILAPCGGPEHLRAAVYAGADAVYAGLRDFSARRNAVNFSADELREAVRFCRGFGARVYVALNILIRDAELDAARRVLEEMADIGPDALIVQDLGLARYIRAALPDMPLHASTQMSVHSLEGARFCAGLGFERVVIARECDRGTLEAIAAGSPCGVEVFVHGALCVSVSGQCTLSSVIGGRSGNRGLCAQPCRLDFSYNTETGANRPCKGKIPYALSLKDLSLVRDLPELARMGVQAVKIEGRMKRPEYTAAAVAACRAVLEGREPDLESLRAVFSRQGFTRGYYTGRHADMRGTRTEEDARAAAAVLPRLAALYEQPARRVPVDMRFTLAPGA
ncbi:MAG: U32 family peptidase, partial [Oscillospiraceae bacterium]|nr:U32 family peptidase [Oscillospiraceae bacterium]